MAGRGQTSPKSRKRPCSRQLPPSPRHAAVQKRLRAADLLDEHEVVVGELRRTVQRQDMWVRPRDLVQAVTTDGQIVVIRGLAARRHLDARLVGCRAAGERERGSDDRNPDHDRFFRFRDWPDSLMAMATACLRDVTLPPEPERSLPCLYSRMTLCALACLPAFVVGLRLMQPSP